MTEHQEADLSPLAAELGRIISSLPRKRIPGHDLYHGASQFDHGLVGDPAARRRFRDALDELQAAGRIMLPAPRSRTGWDTRALPVLPAWVTRVDPQRPPRTRPEHAVWPSALEKAAQLASRPDEFELLARVAAWMRDNPAPSRAPIQERSLELFDDEKTLDGLVRTRLFTLGALTLELLACFIPPVPFVSHHISGTGPAQLLVVENLATYTSFLTALTESGRGGRPDLHLAWGHGNSFTQSVLSIPELRPAPVRAHYFGDLDLAGLRIAVNAAAQAALAGLPELQPAEPCYQFLLDGPTHWRRPDGTNRHTTHDYHAACNWLSGSLRSRTMKLLEDHQRVPQERLGIRALHENPQILSDLWTSDGFSGRP